MSNPVERNNSVFGDESTTTASRAGRISTAASTKSTFSITDFRMGSNIKFTFSKEKSLFIFAPTHPIRTFCVRFICNQWFDHFIITVILINCVLLAMNFENFKVEMLFAVIYTMEMIIKVIARGFTLHKHAYLRDPWNRLDFLVVMFGYLTLIEALSNLAFIKALRVLRSLKVITVVPGLRIMVNSLLKSLKNLSDVMLLTVFFLAVFAIIGLQLFMGNLRNRCVFDPLPNEHPYYYTLLVDPENPGNWTDGEGTERPLKDWMFDYINDEDNWMTLNGGEDNIICGALGAPGTRQCPLGSSCQNTETNPNSGYTSFDNFGIAMLTCAQLITLDYWEDVYSKILGASGAMYIVYFLCILLFGSFYLINLVLAVVAISYEQEALGGDGDEKDEDHSSIEEEAEENRIEEEDEDDDDDETTTLADEDNTTIPPAEKPTIRERITTMCSKCCCCVKCAKKEEKAVIIEMGPPGLTIDVDAEKGTTTVSSVAPSVQDTCKEELLDIWTWFRSHTKSFIYCVWFENGIMLCIIVNTMCLAIDSPGLSVSVKDVLSVINDVLSWIFTTELAIKFVGLLPVEFWQTKWNIFDTIIVFISLIEMNLGSNTSFNVSGLRSLRVLRVFRLAKSWSTMKALIDIIAESISGLVYLSVILGVVIYALSVIGMNLFEPLYSTHYTKEDMPRWHFLDFSHAFILLFRILCGEWIELLYETLDATKGNFWPVIFYICALVMGNFLILNLFLALLLNAFGEEALNKSDDIDGDPPVPLGTRIKNKLLSSRRKKHKMASEIRMSSLALTSSSDEQMKQNNPHNCPHSGKSNGKQECDNSKHENDTVSKHSEESDDEFMPSKCYDCCQCCLMCCRPFCVCCSRFRASIRAVVEHNVFEYTILVLIMVSSLTLAFEDVSLDHAPIKRKVIDCLNNFYTVVFLMELILKMFAFGVAGYFSSAWHWLDSIVVAISIISIILANAGIGGLKAIRALRALRPLRAISRWEGMRLSVNALIASIPSFGNVSLVCLVLWLVFCILAVQFFGDKFWKCSDDDGIISTEIVKNKTQCISLYGAEAWQNSDINFDDTMMAFIALYQVATFEGWMEVMDDAVDSTGIDLQPEFEASFISYIFFLVFIFVGSFFTLNLLVGVIIDNFNRLKKEYEEKGQLGVLLTPGQRQWMSTFRKMTKTKPMRMVSPPKNDVMKVCYVISESQKFEILITAVILLNMVQMCMEHHNSTLEFQNAMWWANLVFSIIYTIEAIIKLIGHRKFYFYKSWNVFDFVIVLAAWFGMIIDMIEMDSFIDPSILRCFRVFRVARILRIIQMAKGIRRLLYTLICSLPALMNIGTLLLLIIYIYSVVGVAMFGTVQIQGILTDQQNFASTDTALIMMTRLATSAGWNDVLASIMISEPDCDTNLFDGSKPGTPGNCGFGVFGIAYFSSFVLVAFLVMINMYIAVILDNFSEAQQADEIGIDEDDINIFYEKWMLFDPKASQFLNVSKLRDLVLALQPPLGIPDVTEDDILHLDIPLYPTDRAHCIDVLQALISRTLGPENPNTSEEFDMIKELMAESFRSAFPTLAVEVIETTTKQRLREIRAAIVLQKALRRFKNYKKQAPPSP